MRSPKPIYTSKNCEPAYQLRWSLTLFWRDTAPAPDWLPELKPVTESDGVRILEHAQRGPKTSQLLLSTRPHLSPAAIVRSVKGRLQYIVRTDIPKAFQRNYSIYSVGPAARNVVGHYVARQPNHHKMADRRVQERLLNLQIENTGQDLASTRRSGHGEYLHNLHVVVVRDGRWMEIREDVLQNIRATILKASAKKGHLLSYGGILPDHIHLTLGCGVSESPEEVALGYLNNLAYAQGMKPEYVFGYYVGTFGEYDMGAVRYSLSRQSSPHGDKPRGGGMS